MDQRSDVAITVMSEQAPDQAMTEIALALAMAFFSIMVLAMVSMGVPAIEQAADKGMAVAEQSSEASAPADPAERQLVVHHAGRFFDENLVRIEPDNVSGPVTLAIDPSLAMSLAIEARKRFGDADVLVSTLDQPWLARLKEMKP
jgi:hypothetical protein